MPGDAQGTSVPLSLFGGLVTEIAPAVQPEGVSPDCQDVTFLLGSVQQRPCAKRMFPQPTGTTLSTLYHKTFVQPNEQPLNLFIDAANKLTQEDVVNSPGTRTTIQVLPTDIEQAQSATAFGREYIACSDGFHGAHVPLQYDGTFLDRVTQDGPGQGIVVGDENVSEPILASPNGLIQTHVPFPVLSGSQAGFLVTLVVGGSIPSPALVLNSFAANDLWQIAGVGSGYDGTWAILTCVQTGLLQLTITYYSTTSGLASVGAAGTAATSYYTVNYSSSLTVPLSLGLQITISGAGVSGYNGTWPFRLQTSFFSFTVYIANTFGLAASGNGTWSVGGSVSVGKHSAVVMFLTRQGYITKPSPAFSWTAAGGKRAVFANLPTGPANVIARIIALTGAGGDNYFYIPETVTNPTTGTTVYGTVVNDNTSSTATIDFSDNALFAATAIDIQGRNYFAQAVLGEVLGFFPYASRLFAWGERNKIQNLVNMGFCGGIINGDLTNPLGWTHTPGSGGQLVNGGSWASGMSWAIVDDGVTPACGELIQTAFNDQFGVAILQPNTAYTLRFWAKANPLGLAPGTFTIQLVSASTGFSSVASIPLPSVPTSGGFIELKFSLPTPATIPSDMLLDLFEGGGSTAGSSITIGELQLIPQVNPYRDTVFRVSYVNAPEQFDGVTGILGATNDDSPIRNCIELRDFLYFNTANGKHQTTDNGFSEPSGWNVPEVTQATGAVSVHASDSGKTGSGESGEQWEFKVTPSGVYIFAGGIEEKISQEIQSPSQNGMPGWDSINPSALQTIWIKNDTANRRCYVGVPTGLATAPNVLFVLDYRELNSAAAIVGNPPYRESFSGRMIAKEFCRKWTRWNLATSCGEILARPGINYEFAIGFGTGSTPTAPVLISDGNSYTFDDSKLTDDDYGQVTPYYTTYFFVSRDQEQQLQLDCHRKLASYLAAFITGTGQSAITPYSDSLTNAFPSLPAYPLKAAPKNDYEWDIWVTGERIALQIGSVPLQGQTDNGFNLQHLAITLKKEPIAPIRGAM